MNGTVAVTGASGLVGTHLTQRLAQDGVPVRRLVRRRAFEPDEVAWDPASGVDPRALQGVDAVVHLAGESLLGRWTDRKKEAILRSRTEGTTNLCESIAAMEEPPRVLVSASAVGYYGDRGEEVLTEDSAKGEGFLSDVCARWEEATQPAADAGVRVVLLRSGVILDHEGGALAQMLPFFRAGLGGRAGTGRQWMAWVTNEDQARVIRHCIAEDDLSGPVNSVAASSRNREFTEVLGDVLHRPTVVPVPATALRVVYGEVADAILLASQNVASVRLAATGFTFRHDRLEAALRYALGQEQRVPEAAPKL